MRRSIDPFAVTLAAAVLAGAVGVGAVAAADDEPAESVDFRVIRDVIVQVSDQLRDAQAERRRAARLCRALASDTAATEACHTLVRYGTIARELERIGEFRRKYERQLDELEQRAAAPLDTLLERALSRRADDMRDVCGERHSVLVGIQALKTRVEEQRQSREHLLAQLGSLGPAREFGEVRELLDDIDEEDILLDLANVAAVTARISATESRAAELCDGLQRDMEALQAKIAARVPPTSWQLSDPRPTVAVIDLPTGFEGVLDPESDDVQLYVTYTSEWLDEDLEREPVLYEIVGWYTPPPDRLAGGERVSWTIGASIEGEGSAPVRLFMCYSARGISGPVPERCAVVGLPPDRFEQQSDTTDVGFEVPTPAGPDDRFMVTVNAGTLATPLRYVYVPAARE